MKTEQFDDEFRKKLLGPYPSEDDVDRIYKHVASNGNTLSYFPWGKILAYGFAASLLVGSLTFNHIQNITNKKLLASLDSLKNRITSIDPHSIQKPTLRVDTVYVDRYIEKSSARENQSESLYARQSPRNEIEQTTNNPLTDESVKNTTFKPGGSSGIAPSELVGTTAKSIAQHKASGVESNTDRSHHNMPSEITDNENNPFNKAVYTNKADFPKAAEATQNHLSDIGTPYNVLQVKESKNWLLSELSHVGNIHLFTGLKLPVLKAPMKLSSVDKSKPKYYSESIKSVLKKMDYYVGGSLDAGNRQVGASLIGELRITPKWSFQTGARWTEITGDSYDTAEQYSQRTGQDFRTLYAPYVAANVDLLNIEQNYQLVQIPLTVAYHYEIAPNWALRFGIGTDLSIYFQKDIHFAYKENSQSFNRGEYDAKLAVKPFNDITINLGLDRSSKKFLFRVSPHVSPQLNKVEFSKKGLSWGAKMQVLYKLNK